MRKKHYKRLIFLAGEVIGFIAIIAIIWLDEIIDIPRLFLGAPPSPINWRESLVETIVVVILGLIVLVRNWKLLDELYNLNAFLPVCSHCRKIRVNDKWITLEAFMDEYIDTQLSHGMCPDCLKSLYPEFHDSHRKVDDKRKEDTGALKDNNR